jgi:uncharacterized alpha-E superfamily protein
MLSRVADSLYWMSRYLERAENTVRLLDTNMGLMLDKSSTSAERRWQRVLATIGNPEGVEWKGDVYEFVDTLCFNDEIAASVTSCIVSARENARQVREEISSEQWQRLNRLFHEITRQADSDRSELLLSEFLPAVVDGIHLFQGVTDTTLSHGEGWQFIQIGRYIERAASTARLLEFYHHDSFKAPEDAHDGFEYLEWIGLLRTCTAFEAYCKVYTADLTYERILEFLVLDADFPHSIRFCIDSLVTALGAIQQDSRGHHAEELMRLSGRLQASLRYGQISEILERDTGSYLRRILDLCRQIHELIYEVYIRYSVQTALAM